MSLSSNITLTRPPAPQPPKQSTLNSSYYPANFVEHPNIGHIDAANKLFSYIVPPKSKISIYQFYMFYQAAYLEIVKDFDAYLEWRQEEFWKAWEREARFMISLKNNH